MWCQANYRYRSLGSPFLKLPNDQTQPSIFKILKPRSPGFYFDEFIAGSENKPVYNKVARNHVNSAMGGHNAVVFAYEQTAF